MTKRKFVVVFLIALLLLITWNGTAFADIGVPAVPEVQGLTTGTVSDVVGTVTETDSGPGP
ncbi:MAG TPA: hypothetical protein VMC42_01600 [Methanoregulaceae archaeon]|nr:hypothetical protein [Methanoregulaceae archaeon]